MSFFVSQLIYALLNPLLSIKKLTIKVNSKTNLSISETDWKKDSQSEIQSE